MVEIMESQKILKNENEVVIICDFREKEVIGYLRELGVKVNELALDVGDFIPSEKVGIERKTMDDFISSIIDGRIFEQAKMLKESFDIPIIIVEGYSNRRISENAKKGAIASLLIDFNTSIINTRNPLDTATTIYWIARRCQLERRESVSFKVRKKKGREKVQQQILSSFPGISKVISSRLLKEFGSLEKIFNASEVELMKVKGVGEKLARNMKNILRKKWEES